MKAGRGNKAKGSQFERLIAKELSLWVSDGKKPDCFWRSAMSGGRATIHGALVRQAGDICAVEEEGIDFCRKYFVECKHVKKLALDSFFVKHTGPLHKFWKKAVKAAEKHGRDPLIIARQNGWPILVISKHNHVAHWAQPILTNGFVDVTLFNSLLKKRYN